MPMYRKVNKDFFKKWTPEMAYVFGFFVADGNMIKGSRGNHYISFHSTDRSLLRAIQQALNSEHKLAVHKRPNTETGKWKTAYQIQIGSKEMFEDILKLGMAPRKSSTLSFPEVPKKYLADFVRGYFDGDGCVSFGRY